MNIRNYMMNTLPLFLCLATFSAASFNAHSEILKDSYESGDMSTTNIDGFTWAANNGTSIVTADRVVWNNGPKDVAIPDGRDWTPKDGLHSLRFSYPAGENSMAEQRFSLGTPKRDLWLSFWLRVPINFDYPTSSPSNSKLLAVYMDRYSHQGDGPTVIWGPWSDGFGGANVGVGWSEGGYTNTGGTNKSLPEVPFISAGDDGKWMHLVFHVKAATSDTSNDGVIQMYRRWDGDPSYTQIHNATNANIPAPTGGPNGWAHGYLMGWSNPGFSSTERTDWLLDGFTVSDTSPIIAPPNPPLLVE